MPAQIHFAVDVEPCDGGRATGKNYSDGLVNVAYPLPSFQNCGSTNLFFR